MRDVRLLRKDQLLERSGHSRFEPVSQWDGAAPVGPSGTAERNARYTRSYMCMYM